MTIDAEVLSVTELLRPWEGQMVTFRNIADLRKQVGDAIDAAVACERERSLNVIAGEIEARMKCEVALTAKDAAMGVLFERLSKAGIDCSDLIP